MLGTGVITLSDLLAAVPGARAVRRGPERFAGFGYDSRIIGGGELFVCVRTATGDGHDHAAAAVRAGAAGVLAARPVEVPGDATVVVVDDPVEAAAAYGARVVREWGPTVVGVTGSVGKTGTKEAVATALGDPASVFRTPGNHGGRYGLALALGGLEPTHSVAVCELATGHVGELAAMTAIAPPTVGILGPVTPVHLDTFGDLDGLEAELATLPSVLPPGAEGGLLVVDADDPRALRLARRTAARVVTVGRSPEARWRIDAASYTADGTRVRVCGPGTTVEVAVPTLGPPGAWSAAVAVATAVELGVPADVAAGRLGRLSPLPGRLRPLRGLKGALIIDDSDTASPAALEAGLQLLGALPARRRVVVLGDMAALGRASEDRHVEAGRAVAEVADVLVTRGPLGAVAARAARRAGMPAEAVHPTWTAEDAFRAVEPNLEEGTVVLVTGSLPGRMEQVTERLLADPADRVLLTRQHPGWRGRVVYSPGRPTWLEVDLEAIGRNASRLAALAEPAELCAVLKADAYGHGAGPVAHTVLRNGARRLAVACLSEAEALRSAGVDAPILVLGWTPGWQARQAVAADVTLAVFDEESARHYSDAAGAVGRPLSVHLKVDTGMHRLGVHWTRAVGLARVVASLPGLVLEGVFTHFARADETDPEGTAETRRQLDRFARVLADLRAAGLEPPLVHAANSAGLLRFPEARFTMVRPGIALYGLAPAPGIDIDGLEPALTWKSQIAQIHRLAPGDAVGYGHTWVATRPSLVATIPAGYGDGFRRAPRTWRHVLVRGRPAPVIGRVSMDQSAIDITDVDGVRQGDEVVLIGRQGDATITVADVAGWLGTSVYEVIAEILPRVPRLS